MCQGCVSLGEGVMPNSCSLSFLNWGTDTFNLSNVIKQPCRKKEGVGEVKKRKGSTVGLLLSAPRRRKPL
jgi:hypothetical protein